MKKFLTTLIYGSLACIVLIYLFSAMRWSGFGDIAIGVVWLHVGAYMIYSLMIKDHEPRIIYPLIALTAVVLVNIFKLGAAAPWMSIAVYFFLVAYAAFHLLAKDYLDKNEISFLSKLNITAVAVYLLGGVMKLASLQFSNEVFIAGSGMLSLVLLLTGATKGLERQK
jgi:hypothetical protein